jgi:phage shock protein A
MRVLSRLTNLVRGMLRLWIGRREHRNPGAVYEAAIHERTEQYAALRQAAAGVLYMRNKLAKELAASAAELKRLREQLDLAVAGDDDDAALVLITRRDVVTSEIERLTGELGEVTKEAETAKRNLIAFQTEIARLKDEKVRTLARLANAKARLRLHETLNGLSTDADIQALDAVRGHVDRLVEEARMSAEIGDQDLERRLGRIRDAEAATAARSQLDELKRARAARLLPLVLPEPVPARAGRSRS